MPKQVDHEHRRLEIVAALWRIAGERGLEAVSLSEVATEAGISKGLVQHYFPTKDAMLRHATMALRDRVGERMPAPGDLRSTLVALLPLSPRARADALVANAFLIRARRDPQLAEIFRRGHTMLRAAVADLVRAAQLAGDLPSALDPASAADLLLALVHGLGEAILLEHHAPDEAIAILDRQLGLLAGR